MKAKHIILIGFALLLAHPFALQAQIPGTLSYQGIVTDAAGSVKPDGTYSFTFKLYDVSSEGTALWTESKTISVKDGLFSTALGDQVVFPASLIFDKSYWLGIKVGSEAELSPRIPLTSVGYSFTSLRADTAEYAWQTPTGEGLTLPYSGTYSGGSNAFEITNTGTGQALKIYNQGTNYALGIFNDASAMYGIKINNDGNYPAIKITNYNSGNNDALEVNQFGTGNAGYFDGDVEVTGNLSKGGGSFKIDHPLEPENKYLYHSFVESPDMMNVYNGNIILDNNGEAIVELPEWFEALNKDFRYQLSCIGGYAPVYIDEEISNNSFKISGGTPGMKISWQITGIRQDPYANENRIQVEVEKPDKEKGHYLHYKAYNQPIEKSMRALKNPELLEE